MLQRPDAVEVRLVCSHGFTEAAACRLRPTRAAQYIDTTDPRRLAHNSRHDTHISCADSLLLSHVRARSRRCVVHDVVENAAVLHVSDRVTVAMDHTGPCIVRRCRRDDAVTASHCRPLRVLGAVRMQQRELFRAAINDCGRVCGETVLLLQHGDGCRDEAAGLHGRDEAARV